MEWEEVKGGYGKWARVYLYSLLSPIAYSVILESVKFLQTDIHVASLPTVSEIPDLKLELFL